MVVEGNRIGSLRVAQEKAISRMRDEVIKGLERSGNEIEASLQRHSSEFIDGIERQINVNIELTERLLEDKEASIRKCNTFIHVVAACKNRFQSVSHRGEAVLSTNEMMISGRYGMRSRRRKTATFRIPTRDWLWLRG